MASARAMVERRRSSRVEVRIPIKLFSQDDLDTPLDAEAEAVAVNHCGALLHVYSALTPGTGLRILNALSRETLDCRVVRVAATQIRGRFECGVEILYPSADFWAFRLPADAK